MSQNNLKKKAVSGVLWSAVQKYSSMFVSFVSGIILARLLTPFDYGCIGMLSIFMVLAEAFIDGGFGSALIQKKQPSQEDYSTIFFWNLFMAIVIYFVLFLSAPAISRFYSIPLLCPVLRVQGLVLFIYAFNIIQRNQLRKNLNFKILSIVTIVTSLISLGVTVFMAYKGCGVWSLVAQNIITAAIPAIIFWFFVKWRPKLLFSWKSFKELFNFGGYMFLTDILNRISTQIEGLLIGKWYNPETLGYFSKARSTEQLASSSVSNVMSQVTYPLYAAVQDDNNQLIAILKRLATTLSYVTTPIICILCLCAEPIFVLLYSDRWLSSVPYFQILCVAGVAFCLQSVNNQTIAAIGKSKEMFSWTLIKRSVSLLVKISGLIFWGIKGLLLGVIISTWFAYFINIYVVSKYIGYKVWQQIKDLLPVLFVSALAFAVSFFAGGIANLNLYLDGILKFLVFLLIYMAWSFFFKPDPYEYLLDFLKSRFNHSQK